MYKNGFFQLCIKNDGIYMKIFPALNGGTSLKFDDINRYLTEKRIINYDIKALHDAVLHATSPMEVKIGNQVVLPENEDVKITISADKMTAIGKFYPPSTGGKTITKDEIIKNLLFAGVKCGVMGENIDEFYMNRQYCTDIILAQGIEPVKGHDAVISYHFKIDKDAKPKENEDGSVDFHQLDIISNVKKGDILATLKPVEFGKPGIDVYGKAIPPDKVIKRIFRYGKNIYLSEDGCTMYSDVNGHVRLDNDKVMVSDIYEVPGDVNTSTGDINYEGNVHVRGNVITGFSVRAAGDIEVDGVVEGATLIAGGQIILKRGIQGMNRGRLEAKGNIVTKFIESCEVHSGAGVTSGAILHSKVLASGDITVNGRNGSVTGGTLRSASLISVKMAGSTMGTHTTLEVGVDPTLVDELYALEKGIPVIESELKEMSQVVRLLQKKLEMGELLSPQRAKYLQDASVSSINLEEKLQHEREKYEEIKAIVENTQGGMVKVSNMVYPGVKIVISNITYFVRSELHYSKFIRDGADILVKPY